MSGPSDLKSDVRAFWEAGSCGEAYARGVDVAGQLEAHRRARYELEPYIAGFAGFELGQGKDVLEVGVGMGADHLEWAKHSPRMLIGIDFTKRAVEWTGERLRLAGFRPGLAVADAERLPFPEASFDLVYSWGVLHHTPNTSAAIAEVHRVLRPGGEARIMIYHSRSIVGYLLWLRYGLLAGRPRPTMQEVYADHLESPGTKAYTVEEARRLFAAFSRATIRTGVSAGDLLQGAVGQQHQGRWLDVAKRVWPRALIRKALPNHGLLLLVRAAK